MLLLVAGQLQSPVEATNMLDVLTYMLYGLWLAWLLQAVVCLVQVKHLQLNIMRREHRPGAIYRPRAIVIVPVKGADDDLTAHVAALCRQDYPDYQLVFVVESRQDPAHAVLERELSRFDQPQRRLLVAGPADADEGQKVHNQLAALRVLDEECSDDDVWVFADADAVPGPYWLAAMVRPLRRNEMTAMSTGYRWLVPTPARDGPKPTLWSHLASVINSSVASQLGRYPFDRAWGGSMAITVATARRGGLIGYLQNALADDYQCTRMCHDLKLRISFAPQCLVASPVQFTGLEFFEFARRQYRITRVYAATLYLTALALTSLYVAGFVSAAAFLIASWTTGQPLGRWWPPAACMLAVFITNQLRSSLRASVVEHAYGPDVRRQLTVTLRLDRWATTFWMTLHWLVVLSALAGRTITWRGNRYRMRAPQRVEQLNHSPQAPGGQNL